MKTPGETSEGLWIVQFHGPRGDGGGVAVLMNGQVLGGDGGSTYTGTYDLSGNAFRARISVKNFDPAQPNVFGVPGDLDLVIEAEKNGDSISGIGVLARAPDSRMALRLKKAADLK